MPPIECEILIQQLDPELPLPEYGKPGDAGMDLRSAIELELAPGERAMVPTGIAVAIPEGYAGFVHPRSGLAARHGLSIVNTPGTIDAGYRGEICVLLINLDPRETMMIFRGDRIAQLVIQQVATASLHVVGELPSTDRGAGGFGSTGVG